MTSGVDVLAGELRARLLEVFEGTPRLRGLLAAPGLLADPPEVARRLAAAPSGPLSARDAHAWRRAFIEAFAAELDALPQDASWDRRLARARARLAATEWQLRFFGRHPVYERLVCRADETAFSAAPLTPDCVALLPERALTPVLRGESHRRAREHFDRLWQAADDVAAEVVTVIDESWAGPPIDPEDLYYKVLIDYFEDTLEDADEGDDRNPMLAVMTDFQIRAFRTARGMLRRYGGVFLADVVGLGKTFIGLALIRDLQIRYGHRAVVVAPPAVCAAWRELADEHGIDVVTVSHGKLSDLDPHRDREVLVVDESHNFRHADTARHAKLTEWLRGETGVSRRHVILISATPQNNRPRDVLHQLQLFPDGFARLPYVGESLEGFFKDVQAGRASLRSLLQHVVVRRTRRFIQAQYPDAKIRRRTPDGGYEWVPLAFPERVAGPDQCLRYSIDAAYPGGLYARIIETLAEMDYPLYGLAAYVRAEHGDDPRLAGIGRAGHALRGIIKVLLLKRLESSVHAFRQTLRRLRARLRGAHERLRAGEVVVRRGATSPSTADDGDPIEAAGESVVEASLFHADRLELDILRDLERVGRLYDAVETLTVESDAKLARLRAWLEARPPRQHRTLVFTQFAETAEYLGRALGDAHGRTAVVTGSHRNALRIARRFAPRAQRADIPPADQIDLLIATDALSEGVNLQDADTLVNYDLHWNPVRLIQRAGRIDRIGSPHEEIHIASFLPERALEQRLGLEEVIRRRIDEIEWVFGEDGAILPRDEAPTLEGVTAAYDGEALAAGDETDEVDALGHHAERILTLRDRDPERFARLCGLRDGRRAVAAGPGPGITVTRAGWLWAFWRATRAGVAQLDHRDGLDALWRHAAAGPAPLDDAARHNLNHLAAAGRQAFEFDAALIRAQRAAPRLSAPEKWVLDTLETHRPTCPAHRRPHLDRAIAWVTAAQHGARLQPLARRWRRARLTPAAILQELLALLPHLPLREDPLGPTRTVATLVPPTP